MTNPRDEFSFEETAATEVIRPQVHAPESTTVVIEDGLIPRRLRRPLDLLRFVIAIVIAVLIVLIGYFATSTTAGLDQDITSNVAKLPSLIVLVLNVIGGIGTLGLPIATAIYLIIRKRVRQLFDALLAGLVGVIALMAISFAISSLPDPRLQIAMGGASATGFSTSPILGGLVAFVTVARLMSRRTWNAITVVVIGSLTFVEAVSSGITLAGVGFSVFLGWAIGLILRYALGTQTTRPSGVEVADALARGGYPVTVLRALEYTRRGRAYVATTRTGAVLDVNVLDRDLEGSGLVGAAWRELRFTAGPGTGAFNMRRTLDHSALVSYGAQVAGVPMPRLLLASEVGPDSALLAFERLTGTTFNELDVITDDDLEGAWRAVRTLHEHQMAHRSLTAEHLLRDEDGAIWLPGTENGQVAASDVALRIDLAELLVALVPLTTVDRAVAAGRRIMGVEGLAKALPALQPVALNTETRRIARKHKQLMVQLRDTLIEIKPGSELETIQFERFRWRTVVMVLLGTVAAYVLLSQLADVDLLKLLSEANWSWVAIAFVASLVTYVGAAWSLSGFVPEKLKLHRVVAAQVAGDFATLVSPPTLGAVAINLRFLQRAGLHPALAAASVGVSQVMAFVFHLLLLLGFGIAAGTSHDFTFNPPRAVVIAVIVAALLSLTLLAVPKVRKFIATRVRPMLREVIPRMVTIAQRPLKLIEGIGGILVLNLAYVIVLVASVKAFGGEMNFAVIAVVYLAGATIGQAAPTPGGLGAVEAALTGGLIAAGLDGGIALSAVLLYRLVTFWIPTVPGYFCFNWLQKKGAL